MKIVALIATLAIGACAQQSEAEWELDVLLNIGAKPPLPHWNPGGTSNLWPRVEELLARTSPEAEIHAEAATWLMTELVRAGEDVRGFRIHHSAMARMAHLPDDHPKMLRILEGKAAVLHETRRFRQSAAMRERIVAALQDESEDSLDRARFELAVAYRLSGQLDRAEAILRELHHEGANTVRFSDVQDELGLVLDALGRTVEADIVRDGRERPSPAIPFRGRACHIGAPPPRRAINPAGPLTLNDILTIEELLTTLLHRPVEARRLLDTSARQLAADHLKAAPETIDRAWSGIVKAALQAGLSTEAERMLQTQIELIETHRGHDSPSLDGPRQALVRVTGTGAR